APFDGRVLEKRADLGAVIAQGAPVAQIYSAADMEVEVSLRNDEAALIPDLFSNPQALAFVETDFAGVSYRWTAEIARVDRQIDAQTRTIDVVLRLADPENGQPIDGAGPPVPALVNAYVRTRIEASSTENLFIAQSEAVRAGDTIWIVDGTRLQSVDVNVLYRNGATVYFTAPDLAADARIITSQLATATDGMEIELAEQSAMVTTSESN
ncbi:MAG: HlyD family efflux transporter periplasmic adaptor subunit, partial [Pseudomonadota bacterium]